MSPPSPPPPSPEVPPPPPRLPSPLPPPPAYADGVINKVEHNVAGVGTWGGTCICPNGEVFQVGDNGDGCASIACIGGISGECGPNNPEGAH
eukprot:scaffold197102_cov26-Tisochrysis_lutea.AAC.1